MACETHLLEKMTQMVKVLLIDDDVVECRLFEAYILRCETPVDFHFSSTLEGGINIARSVNPDVIFLDDRLVPFAGCEETIPQLRRSGISSPLVVISAAIDSYNKCRYEDAGADGYLDKSDINLNSMESLILDNCAPANAVWSGQSEDHWRLSSG